MLKLSFGNSSATISPNGAWVEHLDNGGAVFFPKTTLVDATGAEKARGGMHVCLPNFGPGGDSGLAQHGFGRTSSWTVMVQEESQAVLGLEATTPGYVGLFATLTYRLESSSLLAELTLMNRSSESMRVAPGFHPYFALDPSEKKVIVNGVRYELNKIEGTVFIEADQVELITKNQQVILTSKNLTTWAIWTDQLGPYVCVEPTFGGNRFLEAARSDEVLAPAQARTYSVRISW